MVATKKQIQKVGPESEGNVTEVHQNWKVDLEITAPGTFGFLWA